MHLGVHISGFKKIFESFDLADKLKINTMQIFSRSPQRLNRQTPLAIKDAQEFVKRKQKSQFGPVFVHASYLLNLASPEKPLYRASIDALVDGLKEANTLEAEYLVVHMGSHKATSEDEGLKRLIDAVNEAIDKTPQVQTMILLENTSGSGSWLGYKFIHQQKVWAGIEEKLRVGFCFDTAHAFLAGYDLSTPSGVDELVNEFNQLVGIEHIKGIHLNDSKGSLGSKADRHEHIGKGGIGLIGMKAIVNHPLLKNKPFILETPKDTPTADAKNLKTVLSLIG